MAVGGSGLGSEMTRNNIEFSSAVSAHSSPRLQRLASDPSNRHPLGNSRCGIDLNMPNKKAPGTWPGASIQGGFTSGRRRDQRPLPSHEGWNTGAERAVFGDRTLVLHAALQPPPKHG